MAQVNATVGDISANADLVMDWSKQAADAGAHLVLFPEMMLTGYPVEDLALRRSFVEASRVSIKRLAHGCSMRVLVILSRWWDISTASMNPTIPRAGTHKTWQQCCIGVR